MIGETKADAENPQQMLDEHENMQKDLCNVLTTALPIPNIQYLSKNAIAENNTINN